jgi:NDP-sugar pyrophosphorylase family protein
MSALVFADRPGNELLPLTKSTPVALLPVGGKALIEHTLEDLAAADVRSITLVLGEQSAPMVEQKIGHGEWPGMNIDYVRARSGESPTHVARRFANQLPNQFLAMRGDVYRSPSIASFRRAAMNILATQVIAQIDGRCAQLCLCRQRDLQLDALSWAPQNPTRGANWRTVELDAAEFSQLHDITEFYLANIDGLDERVAAANVANGLPNRHFCSEPNSCFRPEVIRNRPVLIGSHCEIKPDVQLHGPIVMGDDVYVDEGVFLYACVVMPGTYIPAGTHLRNAIVTSEMAVGIDGNVICRFADRLAVQNAIAG